MEILCIRNCSGFIKGLIYSLEEYKDNHDYLKNKQDFIELLEEPEVEETILELKVRCLSRRLEKVYNEISSLEKESLVIKDMIQEFTELGADHF